VLEVAYTNLTKNYGFLPMRLRPNKTIDKPILFNQIPKQAQEDLGPQNIVQIFESLRNCCNAFSAPRNGKKPRTQSMPSIAGYSMPTVSTTARPMYPSFGVVTAGNPAQKAEIITARLARFSQAIQNTIQAGNRVCGNCAE